jgi:tetratricopeptide (TPR) repeat protein
LFLTRGRQAYEARRFEQAAAEFERALTTCPNRGQTLLALGQARLMARRIEPAAESFRELLKLEPANLTAHKLLGDALYLAGKEIEAEKAFKAGLALDAAHEPILYALGRIYYQQKRYPEAVEQFQKVLAIDPRNYRAHDNLALCYDAQNRDSDALRHFFKALDLVMKDHPEYDWAHANLAEFFLKRGQYEKAFQLAAEAAKRNPVSPRNFFLTGKALVNLDKVDLSVRWLTRACELDPNYPEPHYLLAQVYRRLGKAEQAQQYFERFREISKSPRGRR